MNADIARILETAPWPAGLVDDLALLKSTAEVAYPPDDLLDEYGYTREAYQALLTQDLFLRAIKARREEFKDVGVTLKAKALALAEDRLYRVVEIIDTPDMSPVVRLDAYKFLAKMGGADQPKSATSDEGPKAHTLIINLPPLDNSGATQQITITPVAQPVTPKETAIEGEYRELPTIT